MEYYRYARSIFLLLTCANYRSTFFIFLNLMTRFILFIFLFSCSIFSGNALGAVIAPTDVLPAMSMTPGDTIAKIIAFFISLTGILSVMTMTWASIQMILAVGEDEKIKKARYMIIYSLIGLLIAGLAYAIVKFMTNLNLNIL